MSLSLNLEQNWILGAISTIINFIIVKLTAKLTLKLTVKLIGKYHKLGKLDASQFIHVVNFCK